ncbi:MAG: S8/S53 family peptidase [Acidobacteriota bacterium]
MFDEKSLQQDLARARTEGDPDSVTTELRRIGLRVIVEARADQTLDDVTASLREVDERFTVEPLFPEADFESLPDGEDGVTVLDRHGYVASLPGVCRLDLTQNVFDIAAGLKEAGDFARVVPDMPTIDGGRLIGPLEKKAGEPGQNPVTDAWALKAMKVKEGWEAMSRAPGEGVRIGHPDTGWTNHVEWDAGGLDLSLQRNFVETDDPGNARDRLSPGHPGHGTHTAAVMVARGGIKPDYSGTTPPGRVTGVATAAKNVPLRAVTNVVIPPGYTEVARAIRYSIEKRLQVISLSLGGVPMSLHPDIYHRSVDAVRRNIIMVAASGNYPDWVPPGLRVTVEPAWWNFVIGVTGSTVEDKPWESSGRPVGVEISAPGHQVLTATGGNRHGYSLGSGTSYATAQVAGIAATWLSHHFPGGYRGSREAVHVFKDHLRSTARRPAGWNDYFGPGIANLHGLVTTRPPMGKAAVAEEVPEYSHVEALAHELGAESPEQVEALLDATLFAELDEAEREPCLIELRTLLWESNAVWQALTDKVGPSADTASTAGASEANELRELLAPLASQGLCDALGLGSPAAAR